MTGPRADAEAAVAYLDAALTIIESHALLRTSIDWLVVLAEARRRCAWAERPADTYATISWVLEELGDGHSFFSPPERGSSAIASGEYSAELSEPSGSIRAHGIGHVIVPGFRGSATEVIAYADHLGGLVTGMAAAGVTGWIVDLRANAGGNMLPMLVGLGPLLGEGTLGFFQAPDADPIPWTYADGRELWIGTERMLVAAGRAGGPVLDHSPVAILLGEDTASSGEGVAIAFVGRNRTRSFGQPTRGLTTSNESFPLSDGATVVLTTAHFADRHGRCYAGSLVPDQIVPDDGASAVDVAAGWLLA